MQFGSLLRSILLFGMKDSFRAIRFGIQRDWLDRRHFQAGRNKLAEPRTPGSLQWARETSHGAELKFEHASLELLFLAPDVLRISWKPGDLPIPYAVAGNSWPGDRVELRHEADGICLQGTTLWVDVTADGQLNIGRTDGKSLRTEDPPTLTAMSWRQLSPLEPEACIFGLGERACGWNLRGSSFLLWNQDPGGSYGVGHDPLYMSIPVYLCMQPDGHYLIFHENAHRGKISFHDAIDVRFERGALRSYFFYGSPDVVLDRYTQLTGRPAMPPRWSLGYHQSRWGYRSQDEIREVAEKFKHHQLPISAIHLDIDYMDDYRVFTFDGERFGEVEAMARSLREEGIRLVAILDPGVKVDRGYGVFQAGIRGGMFCTLPNGKPMLGVVWPGWVHFPDFTDPSVRGWWGEYYSRLLEAGIAGVWHDMNEPSTFAPWGDKTFPLITRHTLEAQGGDHLSAHNLYGLLMNRAGFEAIQKLQPELRPWLLSRAGFAGGQRYAWNWTGDVETSWQALRQTVATMLGISLSGFAFTGSDVGGFSGTPDAELYLRWFQLGAFSPFFRTHSAIGTPPREPWNFEPTILDAARQSLEMRYRLLPYLYTMAWVAHTTGAPLLRPCFWHDPQDPDLWHISDQYFLGDDLLVAPVLDVGVREREAWFPEGLWYHLWDETVQHGPGLQAVVAELSRIPVFVRGGTILPMENSPTELELHLYLPANGALRGEIYHDDGDGYREYRLDRYTGERRGNQVHVNHSGEGDYPWPYTQIQLILHGAKINALQINGTDAEFIESTARITPFNELDLELR